MTYMDAYIVEGKNWYPRKPTEQDVIRKIVRECWFEGYNVKQIAGYFKLKPCTIYDKINIRGLKLKKMQKET